MIFWGPAPFVLERLSLPCLRYTGTGKFRGSLPCSVLGVGRCFKSMQGAWVMNLIDLCIKKSEIVYMGGRIYG